ncbi:uncharacterized protein LOC131848740 [Achroia grisella]|uniref:uncharacterized protein LOC131848740 n=1 Tax=Achroia grisella TaxID=688607 RepID=UPI0027D2E4EB|nr:uncharacterized protein LOC131848740 [Achroia grisella]
MFKKTSVKGSKRMRVNPHGASSADESGSSAAEGKRKVVMTEEGLQQCTEFSDSVADLLKVFSRSLLRKVTAEVHTSLQPVMEMPATVKTVLEKVRMSSTAREEVVKATMEAADGVAELFCNIQTLFESDLESEEVTIKGEEVASEYAVLEARRYASRKRITQLKEVCDKLSTDCASLTTERDELQKTVDKKCDELRSLRAELEARYSAPPDPPADDPPRALDTAAMSRLEAVLDSRFGELDRRLSAIEGGITARPRAAAAPLQTTAPRRGAPPAPPRPPPAPEAEARGVTYASVLKDVKDRVDISDLGIDAVKLRVTATGARLLQLPAATSDDKAGSLVERVR